jgi:hypothetical protein
MNRSITAFSCVAAVLCLLASCSNKEQPSDSRARVSIREDTLLTHSWLTATLKDGVSVWVFEPNDFTMSAADSTVFESPEVKTRATGVLQMDFMLVTGSDVLFSEGSVEVPMSPNWRWSFEILHAKDDPVCPDCSSYERFGILDDNHAGEYIFLLWRGTGP